MPFRIDIGNFKAETQAWEDAKFHKDYPDKYMDASVVLSVTRETINWAINAPMDDTSQRWRDEIYATAAKAHRAAGGCVGYYRGTNSLHVKRQHINIEEAAFNHNHYRFEEEVTPEMFARHVWNFVKYDIESTHNGSSEVGQSKYLNVVDAGYIIQAFRSFYAQQDRVAKADFEQSDYFKYTELDKEELSQGLEIEGACHEDSKPLEHSIAGLATDIADQRQHSRTSDLVVLKRMRAKDRAVQRQTQVSLWLAAQEQKAILPPRAKGSLDDFIPSSQGQGIFSRRMILDNNASYPRHLGQQNQQMSVESSVLTTPAQ